MIAANELRIGNFVTDEFYESFKIIIKVEDVNNKGINLEIQDDGNYLECAKIWIEPYYSFDKIHGIPLTTEIFEKCGFENWDKNKYSNDVICLTVNGDGFLYLANQRHVNIFYLHQLQNLYFALCGEELNYTP